MRPCRKNVVFSMVFVRVLTLPYHSAGPWKSKPVGLDFFVRMAHPCFYAKRAASFLAKRKHHAAGGGWSKQGEVLWEGVYQADVTNSGYIRFSLYRPCVSSCFLRLLSSPQTAPVGTRSRFNRNLNLPDAYLRTRESIKFLSIDSTVSFEYNEVTRSGTWIFPRGKNHVWM